MEQSPLKQPTITTMAGRPIKILYAPSGDILVACRTAAGEDVHVPFSALFSLFEQDMAAKIRQSAARRE
jgi:hypothetical protein